MNGDYDVKATIYACGRALERNPDIARLVLDTVARAGAESPWLELALCAPWQGGQPGGHDGRSHRRTRTADRSSRARPRAQGSRGSAGSEKGRYVDYELMDMDAMFAPTLADMRAKRK